MRSTFKVLFYLKKNAPKKDGSVPVMCRITIDGTIAHSSVANTTFSPIYGMSRATGLRERVPLH